MNVIRFLLSPTKAKLILSFLTLTLFPLNSFAYNCSDDCESQCRKGFIGHNVDPICYTGCRAWMVPNCYDLSDPYVTTMGELGSQVYPAALNVMLSRAPDWVGLDNIEKQALTPYYGNLVNQVRIHWGAQLMDKWGNPPWEISLDDSVGQTWGYDIFLSPTKESMSPADSIALIGHEMMHTQQFINLGSSLSQFGREYFQSFAETGNYYHISFEVQAYAQQAKIEASAIAFIAHSAPWNFVVCNHSSANQIYAAIAFNPGGLTLVAETVAYGWYAIPKNQCKTLRSNHPGGAPLYAFATTNAGGGGLNWNRPDQVFCVDRINAFQFGKVSPEDFSNCNGPNDGTVGFQSIPDPWDQSGTGTYTWDLTGDETRLTICNRAGEKIFGAQLSALGGIWKSNGWFDYENNQCRNWNLGGYTGFFYIYGENVGASKTWVDPSQPAFCVEHPNAFQDLQSVPCKGQLVHGFATSLHPGDNSWNYQP